MLIDKIGTRKNSHEPERKVILLVLVIVLSIGGVLAFHFERVDRMRRHYVISFLESTGDRAVVYINGQPLDNCDDVIMTLQTLRRSQPHGSLPVEKFEVIVTNRERHLKLVLGTDSEVNTEYWVYLVDEFPAGKKFPSDNDIIGNIDRNGINDCFDLREQGSHLNIQRKEKARKTNDHYPKLKATP